ncbi:MAG: S-adenosylmethionine:tRNA ribosyltransferase-isomerase (EC [uncultured Thiotrichaceae bacterium]|uniref:S-adenosylmethionine:tRNA ribosyltransferase-isomerase n=1 Tax=uncultured Thiotrichaceae bacterium TaxID=298394 RepID=A0A6S6TJJ1_9GAMM|nr:MAG: S-adenosylmethionine:tRNA ribosyltransferase-isomerase (EC [uncultured Thiotrichaceae bacterium]
MKLSDFIYDLPPELIAQQPLAERGASRLLQVSGETNTINDGTFADIEHVLRPNDLLVFNDTRVIPARLFGTKSTGGKIEVLIERVLSDTNCLAHIRASKSPKGGSQITLENAFSMEVIGRQGALFELQLTDTSSILELLEEYGHIPLPPYIERQDTEADKERYQTIFADKPGAVAAPTAGLHFDEALMTKLQDKGINTASVTLHVGAGTFQPVKHDDLSQHVMHSEYIDVNQEACDKIIACKESGGRVVAVGTTSVRSLESAFHKGGIQPYSGDTELFITPGFEFGIVDIMVTNFHLPGSTLLMLVSAFSGYENIFKAYEHAIAEKYRFFSYGDAMLLTKK